MKILLMSQYDRIPLLPGAIHAGANGGVDKSRLNTDLLSSIERIPGISEALGIAIPG